MADHLILRHLEVPLLYDIVTEEMWELDEEALNTLQYFTGTWSIEEITSELNIKESEIKELIEVLGRNIIQDHKVKGEKFKIKIPQSPLPSLRTLLIHTTLVCNLTCRHCYLDKSQKLYIAPSLFYSAVEELEQLGGYKVLISGGEPLLHPQLFEMLESIKTIKLRKLLLSNGLLIDPPLAKKLKSLVHEVQISVDGITSHNEFRNNSKAYEKAIQAIRILRQEQIEVSVATMIHAKNIEELPQLEEILKTLGVKTWALDVPSQTGEFQNHPELYPTIKEAGEALKRFGWGGPLEENSSIYACGAHLCALMPDGSVSKCGFFTDQPVGNLTQESLIKTWAKIQKQFIWAQDELDCAKLGCPYLGDCKGGCRFRAYVDTNRLFGIDKVKCAAFGFEAIKKE
ncbi:MAG: radical SAM protein [Candidatus Helarchaeota archaeon]